MKQDRWDELNRDAGIYKRWAENGPYKKTLIVREVCIQSHKLIRMLLKYGDLVTSEKELRGEPASRSLRQRRAKLTEKVERQHKKLLSCVEQALQQAAEEEHGRRLTRAELVTYRKKIAAQIQRHRHHRRRRHHRQQRRRSVSG
jgi:hypothetical protein